MSIIKFFHMDDFNWWKKWIGIFFKRNLSNYHLRCLIIVYFWCSVHYLSAKSYIAYTILQYMCHDCRPYPSDVTIIFILYCTSALLAKFVSTYLLSYIVVDCILLASFLHSVCISFSLKTYLYIHWKKVLKSF